VARLPPPVSGSRELTGELARAECRPCLAEFLLSEVEIIVMAVTGTPKTLSAKAAKAQKETAAQRLRVAQRASMLLKQVSDPTRLQVILMLADGEMHVGALCDQLGQSQPAVSHHLALLRHGGIIAPRRQGKNNFYGLTETGEELVQVVTGLMD
jgi:DNA-binding transcriptional ArsR family regulator